MVWCAHATNASRGCSRPSEPSAMPEDRPSNDKDEKYGKAYRVREHIVDRGRPEESGSESHLDAHSSRSQRPEPVPVGTPRANVESRRRRKRSRYRHTFGLKLSQGRVDLRVGPDGSRTTWVGDSPGEIVTPGPSLHSSTQRAKIAAAAGRRLGDVGVGFSPWRHAPGGGDSPRSLIRATRRRNPPAAAGMAAARGES